MGNRQTTEGRLGAIYASAEVAAGQMRLKAAQSLARSAAHRTTRVVLNTLRTAIAVSELSAPELFNARLSNAEPVHWCKPMKLPVVAIP